MACELFEILAANWPNDLYITCGDGELIEPDAASSTFPTMVGWKIRVFRSSLPLWLGTNPNGNTYFDYTAITGEATWSNPPADDEEFIIQAYKPA